MVTPSNASKPPSFLDLADGDVRQLSTDEMNVLVKLIFAEKNGRLKVISAKNPEWSCPDITEARQIPILVGRLALYREPVLVSETLILFLGTLCKTPGECVLWAWTLANLYSQRKTAITLERWCHAFPTGIPTDAAKRRIWRMQKSPIKGEDNLLDKVETWS
jgi:hypothetical protein